MNRIEIKGEKDRLTVVAILASNGYTVRIKSGTKDGSKARATFVEYWRDEPETKREQ